jgi:hypothetical protein
MDHGTENQVLRDCCMTEKIQFIQRRTETTVTGPSPFDLPMIAITTESQKALANLAENLNSKISPWPISSPQTQWAKTHSHWHQGYIIRGPIGPTKQQEA